MEKRLLSKEEKLAIINEVEQSGNITQVIRKQYGFSVKLRMTKKREEWILDQVKDDKSALFRTTPFVIPATSMSFPRPLCHSRESGNPGLKDSGSPIKLGMTSYLILDKRFRG